MNTSCIVSTISISGSRSSLLRCGTQCHIVGWKRCVQFATYPAKPRQSWTLAKHLKFPGTHCVIKVSLDRCLSTKTVLSRCMSMQTASLSPFPKISSSFKTCSARNFRKVHLNVGLSLRSISTSNAWYDQSQNRGTVNVKANVEDTSMNRMGTNSREENGASENLQEEDGYLSVEQWKALKDEWSRKAGAFHSKQLFESRTMARLCSKALFQKGRSLLDFVRDEGTPLTYPLMSSYLFLCVNEGNHEELFSIHDWFVSNHSVLDDGVLTNLIAGFCQTDRWRESLRFLQDIKQVGVPSARNYQSVIFTACDHNDYDLVREILQDLYSHGTCPSEQTFLKLLQTFHCETEDLAVYDQSEKLVSDLLKYIQSKRFYPSVAVGAELQKWFHRKQGDVWKGSMTRVTKSGKCRSCGSRLESLDISQEDFLNLQHQITEKVIKAGDIFKKTRPDELEAFMDFVDEGSPYDVVIDGLNVAHIKQNMQPSKMLRQFVVYLAQECGLRCLVLGRQHMLRYSKAWNKHHMDAIRDVADCFFTENVSEDDPFMLYATLHSGPKACYVSRDMLRDHKALLDQPTHISFIKWQRGHQMYPLGFQGTGAIFKERIAYDTVAQHSDDAWHIPCDDGSPRYSYQVPLDWLCARKVK